MKGLSEITINLFAIIFLYSCSKENQVIRDSGFPEHIGKIMITQCAVSGCHNSQSHEMAAGLDLSSWDAMFRGGRNNSSVIPYRPDQSFLLFSVNTFSDLGPVLNPAMPFNKPALLREQVIEIRDWIAAGAPSESGEIKFAGNPNRKKFYVANQGCDFVTVIDLETRLVMRAVNVGGVPGVTESPHDFTVSPDGKSWYVSFYGGSLLQKFNAATDEPAGFVDLGINSWHSMAVSPDSKKAVISHFDSDGRVALVDLETMQVIQIYSGSGLFVYPHGCTFSQDGNTVYIVSFFGNFIYRVNILDPQNPDISFVVLEPGEVPSVTGTQKPYEIDFNSDYSRYFVTCQGTFDVRVFDAHTDTLIGKIPASGIPQTLAFSESRNLCFVANMEDSSLGFSKSSVDIIHTQNLQKMGTVYPGYQPRGLAADDAHGIVYVANRNVTPLGPAPHHTTSCGGRNGYLTLIDMNTLQLISPWKTEVSVDPYSVGIRK